MTRSTRLSMLVGCYDVEAPGSTEMLHYSTSECGVSFLRSSLRNNTTMSEYCIVLSEDKATCEVER